jgi:hypothetical protein
MNFEQAKALRLKQWRSTLDDNDFRMQNPEAYRSSLHVASAQLAAEGLIDKLEQFDLDEMANSAYWLAIEELQASAVLYHSASHYDLVARDGSPNLGTVCQSTFSQTGDAHPSRAYDGKVYRHGEALKLVFSYAPTTGIIEGLLLTLDDGRQFDLVETGRMINGLVYKPIEDPDMYRWLVDSAQVAQESKNLVLMEKIRPFLELARFARCSACLDRFGEKEDCTICDGWGFVPKHLPRGYTQKPEE